MTVSTINDFDILSPEEYAQIRSDQQRRMAELLALRRIPLGDWAVMDFHCRDTVLHRLHEQQAEMSGVVVRDREEIDRRLAQANRLTPNGRELIASLILTVPDDAPAELPERLHGIERTASLMLGQEVILAEPVGEAADAPRRGGAWIMRFPFDDALVEKWNRPETWVTLSLGHANYGYQVILTETQKAELAKDFQTR